MTVTPLRSSSSLPLYRLAAELGTFPKMSPSTTVPVRPVPLCQVKVTLEWAASTLLMVPMVKVLPVPVESPVLAPVGVNSVGL